MTRGYQVIKILADTLKKIIKNFEKKDFGKN